MSLSLGEWVDGTSVSFLQMPSLHPGHYAAASCAWGASSPNGEVGMSHTPPRRGERHKRARTSDPKARTHSSRAKSNPPGKKNSCEPAASIFMRPFSLDKPVAGLLTVVLHPSTAIGSQPFLSCFLIF